MCCGKKRTGHENYMSNHSTPYSAPYQTHQNPPKPDVEFEYTGDTALTVVGGITGTSYRFSFKGDTRQVDYRDAGGMMAVPVLSRKNR